MSLEFLLKILYCLSFLLKTIIFTSNKYDNKTKCNDPTIVVVSNGLLLNFFHISISYFVIDKESSSSFNL